MLSAWLCLAVDPIPSWKFVSAVVGWGLLLGEVGGSSPVPHPEKFAFLCIGHVYVYLYSAFAWERVTQLFGFSELPVEALLVQCPPWAWCVDMARGLLLHLVWGGRRNCWGCAPGLYLALGIANGRAGGACVGGSFGLGLFGSRDG